MELHLRVTELDVTLLTALDGGALDDRVEHSVDGLANVLNQDGVTVLQSGLELAQEIVLTQTHHLQVALGQRLLLAEPLDALQLRINDQRPAGRVGNDGTVLHGHRVGRQAVRTPSGDLRSTSEDLQHIRHRRHRDQRALAHGGLELLSQIRREDLGHELVTEHLREGAHVRDERGSEQHISSEDVLVGLHHHDTLSPTHILGGQRIGQALGKVELLLAAVHSVKGLLLLRVGGVQLGSELGKLTLELGDLLHHHLEGAVGSLELLVGLSKGLTLGLDGHYHLVVENDVDHEGTQTGSGLVLGHDDLGGEVLQVGQCLHFGEVELGDGLFIDASLDGLQVLNVLRNGAEQLLLTGVPTLVLDFAVLLHHHVGVHVGQQHHRGREHIVHTRRRLGHGLCLSEILLVEGIERRHSCLHHRLGLGEILLSGALLLHHIRLDHRHLLGLHLRLGRLDLDNGLLFGHHLGNTLSHCALLVGLLEGDLQVRLDVGHRCSGLAQLLQTLGQAVDRGIGTFALALQQTAVQLEELQERLGRGVDMATLREAELVGHVVDLGERVRQECLDHVADLSLSDIHIRHETLTHTEEGIKRPGLEPIDHGTVDDGGELACARAERVTHRREGQHHVQVAANLADEEVPAVGAVRHQAQGLHLVGHAVHNRVHLIHREQIGNVSTREKIVDEHQEALVGDLGVSQQEHDALLLEACLVVHALQVLLEVVDAVVRRDHNLHHLEAADERRETGQRLLATATDSDQQRVATRVHHDTHNARDVLHGVLEQHQVHRGVGLVVLTESILEHQTHLVDGFGHVVNLVLDVLRKVAEHQRVRVLGRVEASHVVGREDLLVLGLHDGVVLREVLVRH
mmetsp:Transcript_52189/g.91117  ORF Transcript_52189/g.91117 Transcript_52189/m.91117 type:complete len:856 (+) Transcript_52189:3115-5682(+)